MKSIQQLLRRPLKLLSGLALMGAAVTILCICVGQALTARQMEASLDELFTSVALLTNKAQFSSNYDEHNTVKDDIRYHLPEEVSAWMEEMAEKFPNVVEQVHRAGMASAYIAELMPDHPGNHFVDIAADDAYFEAISGMAQSNSQCQAMLQIRLEQLGDVAETPESASQTLTGTVEQVIGLQEGFADPTGFTVRIELRLPDANALKALDLTVGESYLVYTRDYRDLDWELRCDIALDNLSGDAESWLQKDNTPIRIDAFDPENMVWLDGEDEDSLRLGPVSTPVRDVAYYTHTQTLEDGSTKVRGVTFTSLTIRNYRSASFTIQESEGAPTITALEGSAEEFLASENGRLWQTFRRCIEVNSRSYCVIGVDDLMAVGDFALERAYITQGRNFTTEEIAQGAKVCILSEQVAQRSGLGLGDTVSLQFYSRDQDLSYQKSVSDGIVADLTPWYVTPDTQLAEPEAYTIIGLYSKDTLWQGTSSLYSFTPNTVFAPKASVSGPMEEGDLGLFQSMILVNGTLSEFEELVRRDSHSGQFEITDQGYSQVKESLHNYSQIANQAMAVGIAVYLAILMLYLLLFPGRERATLKTMASMGATRLEKLGHLMSSSLGILVPATTLGFTAGVLLWDQVVAKLTDAAASALQLELDPWLLAGISLAQLGTAALLVFLISIPLTRHIGIRTQSRKAKQTRLNGFTILAFALTVSMVLCGLEKANQAEQESYETSYQNTPVKVTLISLYDQDAYHLSAGAFERNLFTDERFANYSPQRYLKDLQLISSTRTDSINETEYPGTRFTALDLQEVSRDMELSWCDGYSAADWEGSEPLLILPQDLPVPDISKGKEGTQVWATFEVMNLTTGELVPYIQVMTVAGRHNAGQDIYCLEGWLQDCAQQLDIQNHAGYLEGMLYSVDSQGETLYGIGSQVEPLNLSAQRSCEITWLDGYSSEDLDGEAALLLVPENRDFLDIDPDTPGTQLRFAFTNWVPDGYSSADGSPIYREAEHTVTATIIGTYINSIDSQDIYCAYQAVETAAARVGLTPYLDHISATMKHNDEIEALRKMADQWFADPDKESNPQKRYTYALDIDDSTLENLERNLHNSLRINQVCTILVFILTAGAGFFLGFLMVRSRKREIILMRTLGKPNGHIYRDFALEQMLWLLFGIVLGGALFQWEPWSALALFALIYFMGLSGALLLFLGSALITTMKEAE